MNLGRAEQLREGIPRRFEVADSFPLADQLNIAIRGNNLRAAIENRQRRIKRAGITSSSASTKDTYSAVPCLNALARANPTFP